MWILLCVQDLHSEGHHQGDQPVRTAGGFLRHLHQVGGQLVEGLAGERGVQQGVEELKLGLGDVAGQVDQLILHHVGVGHSHSDKAVLAHHQQVEPGDKNPVSSGGQSEGGIVGELTHQFSRLVDDPVEAVQLLGGVVHGGLINLRLLVENGHLGAGGAGVDD